ncbi:uncharacterized protein [Palaemon carinicauda]|uniref:uncharacterized protein n=1 Tax=Palaemon carinicauda TaxID=392227 RepID=UPI0035B6A01D
MAPKVFFSLVLAARIVAFMVSAAPQEHNSTDYENIEFEVEREFYQKYCPEGTENCQDKISPCFDMLADTHEGEEETRIWNENLELCQKNIGYNSPSKFSESPKPNASRDVSRCALEKMGIIVDGKFHREQIKNHMVRDVSNSTIAVQEAVATSVDACQVSVDDDDIINAFLVCSVRACVSAL